MIFYNNKCTVYIHKAGISLQDSYFSNLSFSTSFAYADHSDRNSGLRDTLGSSQGLLLAFCSGITPVWA